MYRCEYLEKRGAKSVTSVLFCLCVVLCCVYDMCVCVCVSFDPVQYYCCTALQQRYEYSYIMMTNGREYPTNSELFISRQHTPTHAHPTQLSPQL